MNEQNQHFARVKLYIHPPELYVCGVNVKALPRVLAFCRALL